MNYQQFGHPFTEQFVSMLNDPRYASYSILNRPTLQRMPGGGPSMDAMAAGVAPSGIPLEALRQQHIHDMSLVPRTGQAVMHAPLPPVAAVTVAPPVAKPKRRGFGRKKIAIQYIQDKIKRQITFSKRKSGIMKKAYELATLTGVDVLVLISSETGHVYTFATPKFQNLLTNTDGKNLIRQCLSAEGPAIDEEALAQAVVAAETPALTFRPQNRRQQSEDTDDDDDEEEQKQTKRLPEPRILAQQQQKQQQQLLEQQQQQQQQHLQMQQQHQQQQQQQQMQQQVDIASSMMQVRMQQQQQSQQMQWPHMMQHSMQFPQTQSLHHLLQRLNPGDKPAAEASPIMLTPSGRQMPWGHFFPDPNANQQQQHYQQ